MFTALASHTQTSCRAVLGTPSVKQRRQRDHVQGQCPQSTEYYRTPPPTSLQRDGWVKQYCSPVTSARVLEQSLTKSRAQHQMALLPEENHTRPEAQAQDSWLRAAKCTTLGLPISQHCSHTLPQLSCSKASAQHRSGRNCCENPAAPQSPKAPRVTGDACQARNGCTDLVNIWPCRWKQWLCSSSGSISCKGNAFHC